MECKCGAETVQRTLQATTGSDSQKANYQQCPKCFRQHVHPGDKIQYNKVVEMQGLKID